MIKKFLHARSKKEKKMAILKNTKIKLCASYKMQIQTVENSQQYGLSKINAKNNIGINSLEASRLIIREFPEILDRLKEEISC